MTIKTQVARGMRDFLPADVRRREYVIRVIESVYQRYGFEPLETPAVENLETLSGKYGEEGNQLIFKILKRGAHEETGEADLALRYDLTVPLARVVAEHSQLPRFFKRYQIQPVWRADRPARGRFREFYQCDVDVLGSRSMIVEAELCAAAADALVELGFSDFTICLNHRQVLEGLLDRAGIPTEKHTDALVALDKLSKIGPDGVMREFVARGIDEAAASKLLNFFMANTALAVLDEKDNRNELLLRGLKTFVGDHEAGSKGISELCTILELAEASGIGQRLKIDPGLARGLSYYTGAIMEIGVHDLEGSLGGGGRYDKLIGMFLGRSDVPACGFSLGLERIIIVMTERGMFPRDLPETAADVMVTVWDEQSLADSLALAREIRSEALRVSVYPEPDKLGKQFKYASQCGFAIVVVAGPEERARDEVTIKDMRSGEQSVFTRTLIGPSLREMLKDTG